MKIGIIYKNKSKVEFETKFLTIVDKDDNIIINNHGSSDIYKEKPFFEIIPKKDIQLIYFGNWKL